MQASFRRGFSVLLFLLVVFFALGTSKAEPHPKVGDKATLNSGGRKGICLANDLKNAIDYHLLIEGSEQANRMKAKGRVFTIDDGPAEVIEVSKDERFVRVRLTGGDRQGQVGWLATSSLD
ncbi:hypothetical protein EON81_13980 [bacterium]|nr:MAG: hypothetical protein EON81_13980 [bacterium]